MSSTARHVRPSRRSATLRAAVGGLVAVSAALLSGPLPSGALTVGHLARLPRIAGAPASQGVSVNAMACTSPGNCVATEDTYSPNPKLTGPYVLKETGGHWGRPTLLALPPDATAGGNLRSISCVGPGDCVAVGAYYGAKRIVPMAATESAGVWAEAVALPLPADASTADYTGGAANSVSCTAGVGTCVAVGLYKGALGGEGLIETESASTWAAATAVMPSDVVASDYSGLAAVSCWTTGSCEAVGMYATSSSTTEPVAVVEAAGVWQTGTAVAVPAGAVAARAYLDAVSCPTSSACVAVGSYYDKSGPQPFADTASAGAWSAPRRIGLPRGASPSLQSASLDSVSCVSPTSCLAGGFYEGLKQRSYVGAMTVELSAGRWQGAVALDTSVLAAGATPPTAALTAVSCPTAIPTCAVAGFIDDDAVSIPFSGTPAVLPGPPSIRRVKTGDTSLSLTIRPPSSDGGLAVRTYQYSLNAGRSWKNRSPLSASPDLTIPRLPRHHHYDLEVRAVTALGIGPGSPVVRAATR